MADEFAQLEVQDTPWWYETPGQQPQNTHHTAFTSSTDSKTDSNPLVTPSISSGYYDEDDGSNISESNVSEGSYGGRAKMPAVSLCRRRTESNWSNSTIMEGQSTHTITGGSLGVSISLLSRHDSGSSLFSKEW